MVEVNPAVLVAVCSLLSLVLFYLMAVVSDHFLLPALVALCEHYKVPKDVAGATMLAGGASLPELVSNVVSIYVTKTDVGVGTIVGSEIFNHAAILCSVCASSNKTQQLNKLTCFRDVLGYTGALLLLLVAVNDVKRTADDDQAEGRGVVSIRPFTTLPLVLWYGVYAYLCSSSGRTRLAGCLQCFSSSEEAPPSRVVSQSLATTPFLEEPESSVDESASSMDDTVHTEDQEAVVPPGDDPRPLQEVPAEEDDVYRAFEEDDERDDEEAAQLGKKKKTHGDQAEKTKVSCCEMTMKVVTAPFRAPLWLTLPEDPARRPHFCTVVSLLWLCVQSFAMVELLEAAADALHITSAVVGLTVGAVGTSFPNLISAAAAARSGEADMAVSASLGANVFNLCVALGLPWLLYPLVNPAHPTFAGMHDANLTVLTLGLLTTVALYSLLLLSSKCTLRSSYALAFLVAYFAFILAALFAQPELHSIEDREHDSSDVH